MSAPETDLDKLLWRSWRSGMGLGQTVIAIRRAGLTTTPADVQRAFARMAERFA